VIKKTAAATITISLVMAVSPVNTAGGQAGGAAPILPYKVAEWPVPAMSAAGFPMPWNLIQAASVAVSARGTIIVLHRGAHPILEFDANGTFIRPLADGLPISEGKVAAIPKANFAPDRSRYSAVYGPPGCTACGAHSVRVDPQGNIWVVDAAGHVVYKLSPDGKELMRIGTRGVSGTSQTTFNLPTDVAFAPNGDLYVSDGYGSARVVKFSRDGKFLLQWGTRGAGPGEFGLPHNMVVDSRGRVYVTDRDNERVQVFDPSGKFLAEWRDIGVVSALAITPDGYIWTGAVLRDLNGKPIGRLSEGGGAHGAAVDPRGNVYLAQLSGVVQKFSNGRDQ
jgi:DNA-binding beta-propeller fold protein YncE